ncbi:MAG: GNAT family N-acetyltransferase [Deltaproteobacteria bacterium]|nr:GNAT family N-acetyltransferase [Deltaproteobacteria bacterium]
MEIVRIDDMQAWETIRAATSDLRGYSFSYRWLSFQAAWTGGKRITVALYGDDGRLLDVFAGVERGGVVLAGPEKAPGGCIDPCHLTAFSEYFSKKKMYLTSLRRFPFRHDENYELVIDLKGIESLDQFVRERVSRDARQRYGKARRKGYEVRPGLVDDFMECYLELSRRKRVTSPFPKDYFERMMNHLGDEAILKSFWLGEELMGSSLLFVTPAQIHSYFLLSKQKAFKDGLSALIYLDMVAEALRRGKGTANCGPSSPWDGTFAFKRRFGARPRRVFSYIVNGGFLERMLFLAKTKVKQHGNGSPFTA